MGRLRQLANVALLRLPMLFRAEQNGVVLLTLVPFLIVGIIFAPWNTEMTEELARSPQVYLPWVAVALLVLTSVTTFCARTVGPGIATVSAMLLLAIALKDKEPLAAFGLAGLKPTDDGAVPPFVFFPNTEMTELFTAYTFTGLASIFAISVRSTVSRVLFRSVVIALLLDLVLFSFVGGRSVLGFAFNAYFPSQISVLIGLMALMMPRMLVKFVQENRATYQATKQTDPRLLKNARRQTFFLWWPMPLIFLFFLGLYSVLNERLIRQPLIDGLNNLEAEQEVRVYPRNEPLDRVEFGDAPPDTVEAAADHATERLVAKQTEEISQRVRAQVSQFEGNSDAVMQATRRAMPARFPGTKTRSCGFLDIGCYIQNGIKSMINSAYVSSRESMLADFQRDLGQANSSVENNSDAAIAEVERRAQHMESQTQRRIKDTATGLRYFGWASLLYGVLVLIKSLMIVFARVFYARMPFEPAGADEDEEVTSDPKRKKIGKAAPKGSQLELRRSDGHKRYYVSFRSCGNNVVDRRRMPQAGRLALKRLFSRNLMMCLIDFDADRKIASCDLIVDPPAEILQWDLEPSDEIFVDISTVIGFSESCTLGRTISLSLGALIFGRTIYHSVKGPGRLFLRTESKPLAGADKATANIMQSSSLIAWRRDTQFNIVSSLTVEDTFLSGFSVRKADRRRHSVAYDTSQSRRVSTGGGILRMARAFLLPF